MFLYVIVFLMAAFLYSWATRMRSRLNLLPLFGAVLLPALFAGVRDPTVGTDLGTYAIRSWLLLSNYSDFFAYHGVEGSEIGYSALNYIIHYFSDDFNFFLFVHQFILMTCITAVAWSQRYYYKSTFFVLTYLLFMYNMSLSAMRQSIAIVLVTIASTFLVDKEKRKWFYLLCTAGLFFHNSVVFVMILPVAVYFMTEHPRKKILIYLLSGLSAFVIAICFQPVLNILLSYGLVSAKYGMYLGQVGYKTHKIALLVELGLFAFNFFFVKRKNKIFFNNVQYLLFTSFCVEMMGNIVETASRIVIYLMLIVLLFAPRITDSDRERKKVYLVYVSFMLLHFVYSCLTGSYNNTIPYTSKIIGI